MTPTATGEERSALPEPISTPPYHLAAVRIFELLGRNVIVINPTLGTIWRGYARAIATDPSIIIDADDGQRVTLPLAWASIDHSAPTRRRDASTPEQTAGETLLKRVIELEDELAAARRELDEAHATMTELKTTQAGASQDFRDGAATGAAIVEVRMRTLESFGLTLTAEAAQQIAKAIRAEYGGAVNVESLT